MFKADTTTNNQRQRGSCIFTYVEPDNAENRQQSEDNCIINGTMNRNTGDDIGGEITNLQFKEDLQVQSSRPLA